jgi:uncharacterized protein (UPF0333 family)
MRKILKNQRGDIGTGVAAIILVGLLIVGLITFYNHGGNHQSTTDSNQSHIVGVTTVTP